MCPSAGELTGFFLSRRCKHLPRVSEETMPFLVPHRIPSQQIRQDRIRTGAPNPKKKKPKKFGEWTVPYFFTETRNVKPSTCFTFYLMRSLTLVQKCLINRLNTEVICYKLFKCVACPAGFQQGGPYLGISRLYSRKSPPLVVLRHLTGFSDQNYGFSYRKFAPRAENSVTSILYLRFDSGKKIYGH